MLVAATGTAVSVAGGWGLMVPILVGVLIGLGQRDALGPIQPVYAVLDTQVSSLLAAVRLIRGVGDGTWEVDRESRRAFE